jgi:aminocarboxymuconate-semialdehyde decarboxylase
MVRNGKIRDVSFVKKTSELLSFSGNFHPYTPLFYDINAQLAFMDEHGVDMQAVSVSPRLFFYEYDPIKSAKICRVCNDDIWHLAGQYPSRFIPVGGLPLQDTSLALEELERIYSLGYRCMQVGTSVNGYTLDDVCFEPVFAKLEAYKMPVLLHPLISNDDWRVRSYHLSNLLGNPYQTSAAAGNLICSGMLDRFPDLKFILVHGGGFIPYQLGRMNHGYKVRPSGEFKCVGSPETYIAKNFWFDGLTHSAKSLRFLLDLVGHERVLFGTDYPYDMADYRQLENLKEIGCDSKIQTRVSGENFLQLLSK